MSYLPKSQIKENLYTKGGELYYPSNNQEYTGYYYVTSQNLYFTGKYPGDFPNEPLTLGQSEEVTDFNPNTPKLSKQSFWVYQGSGYNKQLKNTSSLPLSYYPKPTNKEYKTGEFQRYFLSKSNEIKFIETTKFEYNKYLNQSPDTAYQLYQTINLSWVLTGNREEVYKVNLSTVQRVENDFGLRGFTQYFKNRFDQFYKDISEESLGDSNISY